MHLEQHHNADVKLQKLSFSSFSSFLEWKKEEELRTLSKYVKRCSPQQSGLGTTHYFYCNRSGTYNPRGNGQRLLKSQGTSKIDSFCTAHIKVKQSVSEEQIDVTFCSLHHNHKLEIAHLPLPSDVKLSIASKIQQGVTIERILDDIRDSVSEQTIGREHLTNKRDILNVKNELNFQNIQKHQEDHVSVFLWINEIKKKQSFDPILLFKQQGLEDDRGIIGKDDFMLCIQTEFQLRMLKEFGSTGICMDATHGTNMYDFQMISVMVVDGFGEGIPVAWALSNKEDETTLTAFLEALHERCGDIKPILFMSDDAAQYWKSWKSVFGVNSTKKYLCSWHVDRAWRKALGRHVSDAAARAKVYHHLRVLLAEADEQHFMDFIQRFMSFLITMHPEFAGYFRTHYLNRIQEWSTCHRVGTLVNTNMHVEAFHRVLKYIYLNGKQNRRLDHLIHIMFKISRDKSFEQIQKTHKGKITHRVREMNKRHAQAQEMIKDDIKPVGASETSWNVPSQSISSKTYTVERLQHHCTECKIKCQKCGVCSQSYTCTCIDYAIHSTACKHIHCVCLAVQECHQTTKQSSAINFTNDIAPVSSQDSQHIQSEQEGTTPTQGTQLESIKRKIESKVLELQMLSRSTDSVSALNAALSHISSAVMVIKSEGKTLACNKLPSCQPTLPPNVTIQTQRYHSTRKRKRETAHSLSKPTIAEASNIREKLQAYDVAVCSICYREDDKERGDEIQWIQCSLCRLWFHRTCVVTSSVDDQFMCDTCCSPNAVS